MFFFFFFQAEDGIRDLTVTGVQTCALPISTIRPLETNEGGYVRADTRGYQFLLDFNAGETTFASIELGALLAGTFDRGLVKDKVVLVGVTATSIKDNFYTPYSRGLHPQQDMPGVAIHAHVISQLLRTALDGAAPMRGLP